jgi:hypothetical protein
MKRRDFFRLAWIPISDRLPPDTKEIIIIWCYLTQHAQSMDAWLARLHAKRILAGEKEAFAEGRLFSHWMPACGPSGEISGHLT